MRSLAPCIAAAVLLASAAAMAQEDESPQRFAVELKFGPYYPDVDKEPGVGSPYEDVFGELE